MSKNRDCGNIKITCRLSELKEGETAEVMELKLEESMKRRLLDLGMVKGAEITCLFRGPFGEPAAFDIMGAVIALRREDTNGIWMYSERAEEKSEEKSGEKLLSAASCEECRPGMEL